MPLFTSPLSELNLSIVDLKIIATTEARFCKYFQHSWLVQSSNFKVRMGILYFFSQGFVSGAKRSANRKLFVIFIFIFDKIFVIFYLTLNFM